MGMLSAIRMLGRIRVYSLASSNVMFVFQLNYSTLASH